MDISVCMCKANKGVVVAGEQGLASPATFSIQILLFF